MAVTLHSFLKAEDGAVVTDWVVLTAAVAGIGLGTVAVIAGGVQVTSGEIAGHLADIDIAATFDRIFEEMELALHDFSDGQRGDWTGGRVADLGGELGELLQLGANQMAELSLAVPSGASQIVLTFDLIGIDSLDDETATITVNGQVVSIATGNHGSMSFANATVPGIAVESTVQIQHAQLGGSSRPEWLESVSTVSIVIDNPGDTVTLGVLSGTNQSLSDESFGIDNMSATAR